MNTKSLLQTTVIPGIVALTALLLSLPIPFNADWLVGFATVVVILGIAAVEYRPSKRLPALRN